MAALNSARVNAEQSAWSAHGSNSGVYVPSPPAHRPPPVRFVHEYERTRPPALAKKLTVGEQLRVVQRMYTHPKQRREAREERARSCPPAPAPGDIDLPPTVVKQQSARLHDDYFERVMRRSAEQETDRAKKAAPEYAKELTMEWWMDRWPHLRPSKLPPRPERAGTLERRVLANDDG